MTKLIHESAFSDNPVTDNRYHGITSLSRMQVCQSSTLELHYKGRQLKFTLDTGVTASLITLLSQNQFVDLQAYQYYRRPNDHTYKLLEK